MNETPLNSFLRLVATDVYKRLSGHFEHTAVVFPTKRARLFFNEYLAAQSKQPLWAPTYFTIGELFESLSPLTLCNPLECVCRLYPIYRVHVENPMDLDAFFPWGEKLLKDFNDLDQHLVNAQQLFINLKAMRNIDQQSTLSQEEREAVKRFYYQFNEQQQTKLKQDFANMWNALLPIYKDLNEQLRDLGQAYEGALHRDVAERISKDDASLPLDRFEHYVFVGFNLLNGAEHRLLSKLRNEGRALFYWDYDLWFAREGAHNEAGEFIRKNLKEFPSPLNDERYFANFENADKELSIVAAQSESEQASYCADWLKENLTPTPHQTAIVLCNENSLLPVLHALPPEVGQVNVTKGFPVGHTEAARLIEQKLEEKNKTGADSLGEQLAVIAALKEDIRLLATSNHVPDENKQGRSERLLSDLKNESCYQCFKLLSQIERLLTAGLLSVRMSTLQRLIKALVRTASVPFHGEPAVGLQVLGMLETRCLSFSHILMLHVNEGVMPPAPQTGSFIPYEIRRAFGMTTAEHEESIFAYYFYRLVARATKVTFAYNAHAAHGEGGEMSHFLLQLLLESGRTIWQAAIASSANSMQLRLTGDEPFLQKGDPDETRERESLLNRVNADVPPDEKNLHALSPSAINVWLTCRLRFYFHYILHLPEPEPPADSIQLNRLGSVFHRAAELFYRHLTHNLGQHNITKELLKPYHSGAMLRPFIEQAFKDENVENLLVVDKVVERLLLDLIDYDSRETPFELIDVECRHFLPLNINTPLGPRRIRVGGIVDRIDRIRLADGSTRLRVVDYKTGGKMEAPTGLDELFKEPQAPSRKRAHYALQAFIYSLALKEELHEEVCPSLLFVHHLHATDFSPFIHLNKQPVLGIGSVEGKAPLGQGNLSRRLQETIEAIFSGPDGQNANGIAASHYYPTEKEKNCRYCPYNKLCGRS